VVVFLAPGVLLEGAEIGSATLLARAVWLDVAGTIAPLRNSFRIL
jgi:hypothetical protein